MDSKTVKRACSIFEKSSNSIMGIEEQRKKQKMLDMKMKAEGKGKRSILKNLVLRNDTKSDKSSERTPQV